MHLAILGWFTSLGNLYIEAPSKNENPAFPNEEMVFFFLEMAAVSHFCREQRAKCIFQAWKNAFGHGSARSHLVLGVVKGCL